MDPKQLGEILARVQMPAHPDVIVGAETHDDAGVIRRPFGPYLIQTTDFFPPMVDDPRDFGRVAAANALSDVYAMGGRVVSALSLVMFPSQELSADVLVEMLQGGAEKVLEAGGMILGGHTLEDSPLKYGLAATGEVEPENLVTNAGARPGDLLILTKPLGTGLLTGARKVDLIDEMAVRPAIDSMITLNKSGAEIMNRHAVKGATDITGFGLLGHAYRFADASRVTFRIESAHLPALPGALDLVEQAAIPGGAMRNLNFVRGHLKQLRSLTETRKWLCLDPQTSGGLLMSVAPNRAEAVLADCLAAGLRHAAIVGEVLPGGEKRLLLA
jgi:selenide,water dikinase